MGIFNKTEEELRIEEQQKKLRMLTNAVYDSYIAQNSKDYLIEYINKIKKGYTNDFDDIDTLIQIVLKLLDTSFHSSSDFINHFKDLITTYHEVVNKEHPNYEREKTRFIEMFVGDESVLEKDVYDKGLFSMFHNKEDYFEIMSIIMGDDALIENFDEIESYIASVTKYCLNQDVLKRDIISYLKGFETVVEKDYEKYSEQELEKAKRRVGVYNLSPKDLASVDTKLRRVEGYLDQFGIYMTSLKEEKRTINSLVESGKKEIKKEATTSIETLRRMIEEERQSLIEKLDAYLLDLEEDLKNRSDETFRQVLETYKSQVQEFRNLFKGYSLSASKDLIAIQKATEESVRTLQSYVTNEPQLQELLLKAQEQNSVREKIVELVTKEEELMKKVEATPKEQVVIPGYDRVMVPYRHIVLPEKISTSLNPFLNEAIPFDRKIEELEKRMKQKEATGEIYHKKVKEIAIDLMEGDWPYLWGPSGTGKSFMIKQVADLLEMNLMKAGKITEPYSILGYNDPQGRFCITPTFMSALYGYLLSLDEFDNGNPDTQVVLNDIYSELLNKIENPQDICEVMFGTDIPVDIHPNFRMIAAGNTSGEGENSVFSSRGKIDESIQERQSPIYIDYDNRVEERILVDYPAWYNFIVAFRNVCSEYAERNGLEAPQGTTTTRDAAAIKKYIEHNSKSIDQIIAEKFIQIKDSEYRKSLGKAIATHYQFDYSNCRNPEYSKTLKDVDEKVLAKKFVHYSKVGVR